MTNVPMKMHYTRDNLRTECNNSNAAWRRSFTTNPSEVTCKTCFKKIIETTLEEQYEASTNEQD